MQTATTDQQIAELRRDLTASRQTVSRLENELNISRNELKAARAEARRRSDTPRPTPPPTPPPRPPPTQAPDSWSPGRKASAKAAIVRLSEVEAELEAERGRSLQQAEELRQAATREERLRAELQRKPAPPAPPPPPGAQELKRMGAELERAKAELEQERETRRALQRRLQAQKAPPDQWKAVGANQLNGTPRDVDEEAARKDKLVIAKLGELGEAMQKMEKHKMSVEDTLYDQVNSCDAPPHNPRGGSRSRRAPHLSHRCPNSPPDLAVRR